MAWSRWGLLGLGLTALSCGGSADPGHVEISGKSPDEAASIAAHALCAHEAECGSLNIVCSSTGSAGTDGDADAATAFTCTARIDPVVYADCFKDKSASIARLLTCGALTADQTNTLEICFDMLDARKCTTQAEAEARARANESGPTDDSAGLPPECAMLSMRPPGCA